MTNSPTASSSSADVLDMAATGTYSRLCDVREPGYYLVPEPSTTQPRIARFNGTAWELAGSAEPVQSTSLMTNVVYGPLQFSPVAAPEDTWPSPGDEFWVFVEVWDLKGDGQLTGFIQNPPPKLAALLLDYGDTHYVMTEELFGQDFLPSSTGLYHLRLRMYVEPAHQIDDHEWSDEEPGLEVLSVLQLYTASQCQRLATQSSPN